MSACYMSIDRSAALQAHAIRRGAVAIGQPAAGQDEGVIAIAASGASGTSPAPSVDIDALVATVQQQSEYAPDSAEIRKSLDVYRQHAAHYVSKLHANHGNEGLRGLLDQIASQEQSQGQKVGKEATAAGGEDAQGEGGRAGAERRRRLGRLPHVAHERGGDLT